MKELIIFILRVILVNITIRRKVKVIAGRVLIYLKQRVLLKQL